MLREPAACVHNSHMAILLATARVLTQLRGRLPGTVKFIFQPAEEAPPPTSVQRVQN